MVRERKRRKFQQVDIIDTGAQCVIVIEAILVFCTVTRACYPLSKKKKRGKRHAEDDPREIKKQITRVLLIISDSPGHGAIITVCNYRAYD